MNYLLHGGPCRDMTRPVGERNHAGAALEDRAFPFAVRAIVAGYFYLGDISNRAGEDGVSCASVVAHENDERIVAHLLLSSASTTRPIWSSIAVIDPA